MGEEDELTEEEKRLRNKKQPSALESVRLMQKDIQTMREIDRLKTKHNTQRTMTSVLASIAMLAMFGAGFVMGDMTSPGPKTIAPDLGYEIGDEEVALDIDGTTVMLLDSEHESMQGRVGYYRRWEGDAIYLQADRLNIKDLYTTCTHEELHMMGIGGSDEEHEYIYGVQDQVVSELCIETVYQYGKHVGGEAQ